MKGKHLMVPASVKISVAEVAIKRSRFHSEMAQEAIRRCEFYALMAQQEVMISHFYAAITETLMKDQQPQKWWRFWR